MFRVFGLSTEMLKSKTKGYYKVVVVCKVVGWVGS